MNPPHLPFQFPAPSKKSMGPATFNLYLSMFFEDLQAKRVAFINIRFRKMRMNAYTNTQKSESRFIKRFGETFGSADTTTVFLGDWSTHGYTPRGQVPSKSAGFQSMFRRWGYDLYLVDEYKTSKVCSGCSGDLQSSGVFRPNPKPFRHDAREVHGLLRCQSEFCKTHVRTANPDLNGVVWRYWNRDVNSVRNIRTIVTGTIADGERPEAFRRNA